MTTTLNAALEIASTGDWGKAWKVAQRDSGLVAGVTLEEWRRFAEKAIARRSA